MPKLTETLAAPILASYNDWVNIDFSGGTIGAEIAIGQAGETPIDERTLEDAMTEPPAPPSGLAARMSGNMVRLVWNPLGQIAEFSYRVYRKAGTNSFLLIDTAASPAYAQRWPPADINTT
jgi:hypothetical protein